MQDLVITLTGVQLLEHQIEDRKSLTNDQILTLCQRGFREVQIESIHELGGGTFNTTYHITLADQRKMILRIAPPHTDDTYWDEAFLIRREHAMQPFFAPVAALMPKTLLVDFTQQLIGRDYMFQTFIEGERWDDVMDELTYEENNLLWEQFGRIVKHIHNVNGETFGIPRPGFEFPLWSQTVINRLERTLQSAKYYQLDIPYLASVLDLIHANPEQLDEIKIPCLLHGDLWSFNILISRESKPSIVGILDADRSWWGEPMADWTMFILAHAERQEGHSHFWKAYGQPENTRSASFRKSVYDAMHAGMAFIWAVKHQDEETVTRAKGTLSEVLELLPTLL